MSVAEKLQIKAGQRVALLNVPDEVDLELSPENHVVDDTDHADALILFVTDKAELDQRSAPLVTSAREDKLSWVAYPKGGRRGTDLNRDSLNEALKQQGVQGVRQVSIDDTWSALRFRPM